MGRTNQFLVALMLLVELVQINRKGTFYCHTTKTSKTFNYETELALRFQV